MNLYQVILNQLKTLNDYLILEECEEVFINGYNEKIKLEDLDN